ncbi:NHL repeat-containing protein [Rhabdothermincola salaria]|uniref:NHL repeat-containing protein n=1 Tax=Rhabdothermincola salaria TaxID=2903142 RepID=UPI001E2F9B81|nr:NHL repeat-containing protein [Rhabdothermincola salaria]MCD9622915.1 NHL repeat-containing protein [Rhabdothermincola salaria]
MRFRVTGHRIVTVVVVVVGLVASLLGPELAAAQPEPSEARIGGTVRLADIGLGGYEVALVAAADAEPMILATATADGAGAFELVLEGSPPPRAVLYLVASAPDPPRASLDLRLVSVLGVGTVPGTAVVNEMTTVAAAYALARFTAPGTNVVRGPDPGLPNAVGMAHNLVDPSTGEAGVVLRTAPNGDETSTLSTVNSLANMVVACGDSAAACGALRRAATSPEGLVPADTHQALVNVARDPWSSATELFVVATRGSVPRQPARVAAPEAWTVALRFAGDGRTMNGPGNVAVDHEGNLYVGNSYEYSPDPTEPVCAGEALLKFSPDGRHVPSSPFTGGGLNGPGHGVTIDPFGDVWVGNYGAAAPGCTQGDQPSHDSVSRFTLEGTAVSPPRGYTQGSVDWPQGTGADDRGSIWIANCGSDSVTLYSMGDPTRPRTLTDLGVSQPFDVAFDDEGNAFITGVGSSSVAVLDPDGRPRPGSPLTGDVFNRPMGIAADQAGNQWVANSGFVEPPCPGRAGTDGTKGSVALISAEGEPVAAFEGGGLTIPWGIAVDGDDNVWISNFAGKRISQFCGVPATDCRPGGSVGSAISPDAGYGFDGLTRSSAVAIDPSGNVWATNHWKEIPVPTNPGGYQIVAYVGLAAPVQPAVPRARPAAPAVAVVALPTFTG